MTRAYVPDAGDLVWLTFAPQTGREQRGRRPPVILSPKVYKERAELASHDSSGNHARQRMVFSRMPRGRRRNAGSEPRPHNRANLRGPIALHLEGDDAATLGLLLPVAMHVTFEDDIV